MDDKTDNLLVQPLRDQPDYGQATHPQNFTDKELEEMAGVMREAAAVLKSPASSAPAPQEGEADDGGDESYDRVIAVFDSEPMSGAFVGDSSVITASEINRLAYEIIAGDEWDCVGSLAGNPKRKIWKSSKTGEIKKQIVKPNEPSTLFKGQEEENDSMRLAWKKKPGEGAATPDKGGGGSEWVKIGEDPVKGNIWKSKLTNEVRHQKKKPTTPSDLPPISGTGGGLKGKPRRTLKGLPELSGSFTDISKRKLSGELSAGNVKMTKKAKDILQKALAGSDKISVLRNENGQIVSVITTKRSKVKQGFHSKNALNITSMASGVKRGGTLMLAQVINRQLKKGDMLIANATDESAGYFEEFGMKRGKKNPNMFSMPYDRAKGIAKDVTQVVRDTAKKNQSIKKKRYPKDLLAVKHILDKYGIDPDSEEIKELRQFKAGLGPRGQGRSVPELKRDFVAGMDPSKYANYKEFLAAKKRFQTMSTQEFGIVLEAIMAELDEEEDLFTQPAPKGKKK